MSRRFQFSFGRLLGAMTLLSVAVASISIIVRESRSEAVPLLLNTSTWSLLGTVGVFADDRTSATAIVWVVIAMIAFGFVVFPS